jgi:hypothetical protein
MHPFPKAVHTCSSGAARALSGQNFAGQRARFSIQPIGWPRIQTALAAGHVW